MYFMLLEEIYTISSGAELPSVCILVKKLIYIENSRNNIFLKQQLWSVYQEFITHSNFTRLILLLSLKLEKNAPTFVYKEFTKE